MASKTLAIFFDGTWNEPGLPEKSNVKLLCDLVEDQQSVYYNEGVGTRQAEKLSGGLLGFGTRARIHEAYVFLQARFARVTDKSDLKIFIFGFSRGAYAARLFAGLLAVSGVPPFGASEEDGLNAFWDGNPNPIKKLKGKYKYFDVPIEFIGVWDTVNSTLEPDHGEQTLPGNVRYACHAMAIDEKRKDFQVERWDQGSKGEEVWFPGCHSDVGGGYPEHELSDVSLGWMISKAKEKGLVFNSDADQYTGQLISAGVRPVIHNSFTGDWVALGEKVRLPRLGDKFHESVNLAMALGYNPTFSPSAPMRPEERLA